MKLKEERKKADEQMKLEKKAEWERKKLERGEMRKEKEQRRKKKQLEKQEQQRGKAKKGRNKKQEERDLESEISALKLDKASDRTDDNAICPKCGVLFVDIDDLWIACDGGCEQWFDFKCTKIQSKKMSP